MTTKRDELKSYFANGQLPSGENFAELIDSMVHRDEFDEHEADFRQWTTRGVVTLGDGDTTWRLFIDEAHHLRVQPDSDDEVRPGAADVDLAGWAGMAGRVGTCPGDKAFAAPAAELDPRALRSVKSDGKWHRIVDAPLRPCAFEIAAAVAPDLTETEPEPSVIGSVLRTAVGLPKPGNAVVHAVGAANGATGTPPTLSQTGHPETGRGWHTLGNSLFALLVVGVPGLIQPQATLELLKYLWFAPENLGLGALVALIVYLGRGSTFAWRNKRNGICIRWAKVSGSRLTGSAAYELQLRGPKYRKEAAVHFHITKLWS